MTQKWQIVLLSAAISYGSGLVAMDAKLIEVAALKRSLDKISQENKKKEQTETRNLLNCSMELRNTSPIEIKAQPDTHYHHSPCGSGRGSSPDDHNYNNGKYTTLDDMKPYPPYWY